MWFFNKKQKPEEYRRDCPTFELTLRGDKFFTKFYWPDYKDGTEKAKQISNLAECLCLLQTGNLYNMVSNAFLSVGEKNGDMQLCQDIMKIIEEKTVDYYTQLRREYVKDSEDIEREDSVLLPSEVFHNGNSSEDSEG